MRVDSHVCVKHSQEKNNMDALFYLLVIMSSVAASRAASTIAADVESAKDDIRQIIIDNAIFRNPRRQTKPEYPFIGGFVRLAFHDCVGEGGCDGCIDHGLPDNKGLKRYTEALDAVYDAQHKNNMSRADFYALASMTALEMATDYDIVIDKFDGMSRFKVGRTDCTNSPNEDKTGNFPLAEFDTAQTLKFFDEEFGFTPQEVVALMGAHTLGRARTDDSGYEGKWVKGTLNGTDIVESDVLNNEFHLQLRGPWEQMTVADSGKIQWQRLGTAPNTENDGRNQPNMFLNSDISLAWDINPVGSDGSVTCRVACQESGCCPRASTHQLWRRYTGDNTNALWLSEFTDVFLKMIEKSDSILTPPESSAVASSDDSMQEIIQLLNTVEEDIVNLKDAFH